MCVVRRTSTRSFGRMKPPAPVSGAISVETARMPDGRIAAMKPEPSALTSFWSRIGSPRLPRGPQDCAGELLDGVRAIALANEAFAGGRSRPALPLQVFRLHRLAEIDVVFRDQHLDGRQLGDRRWRRRFVAVGAAGEIGRDATGAESDGQDDDACGVHQLLLLTTRRRT